jgi:hypothetical protein
MSPQLNLLNKYNLLIPMRNLLLSNLSSSFESSHELKAKINSSAVILHLQTILSPYQPSGFKETASFIGAVCSDLVHQGLVKHSMKICPVTNTYNDAFKI